MCHFGILEDPGDEPWVPGSTRTLWSPCLDFFSRSSSDPFSRVLLVLEIKKSVRFYICFHVPDRERACVPVEFNHWTELVHLLADNGKTNLIIFGPGFGCLWRQELAFGSRDIVKTTLCRSWSSRDSMVHFW